MIHGFYTVIDRKMNNLLYRGYDENGHKVYDKFKFRPVLYLDSKEKNTKWKALDDTPVEPMRFDSMSESKAFIKQYVDIPGFRIHGNDKHIPAFIQAEFPNEIKYNKDQIDVAIIDIEYDTTNGFSEPTEAACPITLIGLKSSKSKTYIVWGINEYDESKSTIPDIKKEYRYFDSESEMLNDFLTWWEDTNNCPDVITGWNSRLFDIPYIVNRVSRVLSHDDALRLSPWKHVEQRSKTVSGREEVSFDIHGVAQLDYLDLFKKFTINTYGKQESYKLDFIAELVLGENKIDYEEEYGNLGNLYKQNHNLYVDYNIIDCNLIEKLEDKIGLLGLAFTLSYYAGINYSDSMGTTAMWDSIIFRYLAKMNVAIPQNRITGKVEYDGGFVKEPITGRHEWNVSFDLNSLYPMLMIQHNMSPETIVKSMMVPGCNPEVFLEDKNNVDCFSPNPEQLTITPNGACFRKDKAGVIPMIVEDLYSQRVEIKKKMLAAESKLQLVADKNSKEYKALETEIDLASNRQMCIKIAMNSLYGAMASRYFRYYDIDIAEGITHAGQYVVQCVEKEVNKFFKKAVGIEKDYVTASDTDSAYFDLSDVIKKANPDDKHKFCVDFSKSVLEPIIERTFETITKKTSAYRNMMKMKLEKVSEVAIFTAKKRYILKVLSSEGVQYREPKIVMKGIEAIKSSTPKICRTKFKSLFNILVDGTEAQLQDEVKRFEEEFKKQKPESLAFPRSVTSVKKYEQKGSVPYIKGTPQNSRAAILYNLMLKEKGMLSTHQKIKNGDRLKFIFLKKDNPLKENVIGFIDKLPTEFGLHEWIDYDVLFDKTFLSPLNLILKVIGWKAKPTASLEDFFS